MTKIEILNADFSDLDATVSVAAGGGGFDIWETSTGNWIVTCDNLQEVEETLMKCY